MLAALTGYLAGSVLLATGLSMGLTGLWAPALLLGHGGMMLWAWAWVRQAPAES